MIPAAPQIGTIKEDIVITNSCRSNKDYLFWALTKEMIVDVEREAGTIN